MNRPLAVTHAVLTSVIAMVACQKKVDEAELQDARFEVRMKADASVASLDDWPATAEAPFKVELTADRLDRYLAYQRAVLKAESTPPADGGGLALLEQVALAEEAARKKFALGEREIDALDEMVTDVLDERTYAQAADLEKLVKQGEEMNQKLPEDLRADFEVELDAIRRQRDAAKDLPEERERYGSANVELLLTREAELTALWNERIRGPASRSGR